MSQNHTTFLHIRRPILGQEHKLFQKRSKECIKELHSLSKSTNIPPKTNFGNKCTSVHHRHKKKSCKISISIGTNDLTDRDIYPKKKERQEKEKLLTSLFRVLTRSSQKYAPNASDGPLFVEHTYIDNSFRGGDAGVNMLSAARSLYTPGLSVTA
jgi:hypothetical protein